MTIKFLNEKQPSLAGWSRRCEYDGNEYHASVKRGKRVRIAFKPRGQNIGYHWHGLVLRDGKLVWAGRVGKSTGVRGLLKNAGIIAREATK